MLLGNLSLLLMLLAVLTALGIIDLLWYLYLLGDLLLFCIDRLGLILACNLGLDLLSYGLLVRCLLVFEFLHYLMMLLGYWNLGFLLLDSLLVIILD